MKTVLECCRPEDKQVLPAGTVLIPEGASTGRLFVLAEGTVEVARASTLLAIVSEPGSMFGDMSALLRGPHTATVKAVTDVTVYQFDDAETFLRSDPQIAFLLARMLAQRLNAATTYLVDLKRQYSSADNHLGMVSDVLATLIYQKEADFEPGSDRQPDPAM